MRSATWFTYLGVVAGAAALDFGAFHRLHYADSLIPVLVSLHHWTFYYWEQNRFGMLTPLLATPFADPVTNLLVQNGLTMVAGLACFPLAARFLGARHPGSVGLVAAALCVAVSPSFFQFIFFSAVNVFAVSMALGLLGFNLAGDRSRRPRVRWPLAAACLLVGSWVNSALGLQLAPLAALVPLASAPRDWRHGLKRGAGLLALCGFGVAAAMVMQRLAPYPTFGLTLPPISQWGDLLTLYAEWCWGEIRPRPWCLLVGAALAIAAAQLPHPALRPEARRGLLVALVVFAGSVAYIVLMMVLFKGRWRYAAPAYVLIHTAAVVAALRPWAATWGERFEPGRLLAATALLLAAVVLHWGPPALSQPGTELRVVLGHGVPEILEAECTHVAGGFWKTWPAVLAANRALRERGESRTVWGLSHRSEPTRPQWQVTPREQIRVACFVNDPEAAEWRKRLPVELKRAETRGPIEVWVPQP